jgi:type VI secretion system protein VasD
MRTKSASATAFCVLSGALLVACAGKPPKPPPPPPPPPPVRLTIAVSGDVNPDAQNRPSPIVVRLYQLKDDAPFRAADFDALYDKDGATLGAALVSREDFEFAPGDRHEEELALPPEVRFIGVVAAYRDIRNAAWRTVARTPVAEAAPAPAAPAKGTAPPPAGPAKKRQIVIAIEQARVSSATPD